MAGIGFFIVFSVAAFYFTVVTRGKGLDFLVPDPEFNQRFLKERQRVVLTVAHFICEFKPIVCLDARNRIAEHEIIRELAAREDCVIVGRCADLVCQDMHPFNIFVYADRISKLQRCESRAEETEHYSEKTMLRKMKQIDRERAAYRSLFTEEEWGRKEFYHLCVNTSGKEIKSLIPAIAAYAKLWFEED